MIDFILKKGDTLPILRIVFLNDDGSPINLAGYSILFKYRLKQDNSTIVTRNAVIEDAVNGIAQYSWNNEDTSSLGVYIGEFIIISPSGKESSFPEDTYIIFEIIDDIS